MKNKIKQNSTGPNIAERLIILFILGLTGGIALIVVLILASL